MKEDTQARPRLAESSTVSLKQALLIVAFALSVWLLMGISVTAFIFGPR